MHRVPSALALAMTLAAIVPAAAAPKEAVNETAPLQIIPLDTEITINGVQVACTGIGETRNDPKWAAYPIRVEFSDAKNWYMTDAAVALLDAKAHSVLTVRCDGPWVLLKPAAGTYAVYALLMDSGAMPRSAGFTVPKHGQKRVVLQFPDAWSRQGRDQRARNPRTRAGAGPSGLCLNPAQSRPCLDRRSSGAGHDSDQPLQILARSDSGFTGQRRQVGRALMPAAGCA